MWEERVAPLSGLGFVVLFATGVVIMGYYDFMPEPGQVVSFYSESPARLMTGAYVGMLGSVFLLWFAGSLRRSIRSRADGTERLAVIAFGGTVFAAVMVVLGLVAISYPAERVMIHGSIDPGAAIALFDLSSGLLGSALAIGLAAAVGGYGLAQLRDAKTPAWLAWVNLVLALGLVSPVNWAVIALGILWLPVVSVSMYRRARADAVVAPETELVGR
ncbi:MAG: hypothetical protein WCE80_14250 [Acidimicrobiia bacterium]